MPIYRHVRTSHVEEPTGERAKQLAESDLWVEIEEGGTDEPTDPEPLPHSRGGEEVALPDDTPTPSTPAKRTAKK